LEDPRRESKTIGGRLKETALASKSEMSNDMIPFGGPYLILLKCERPPQVTPDLPLLQKTGAEEKETQSRSLVQNFATFDEE